MNRVATKSPEPELPLLEIGILAGRDGIFFGPGVLLQGNLGRVGLYGFAGTSRISDYSAGDGVKANLRDRTLGIGVQYRIARVGRHFSISAFGQAAYYGSHIHATYLDSNQTVNVEYEIRWLRVALRSTTNLPRECALQSGPGSIAGITLRRRRPAGFRSTLECSSIFKMPESKSQKPLRNLPDKTERTES